MRPSRLPAFGLPLAFACALGAAGCQNKVADQNKALYGQTHELQAQLDDARAKLAAAPDANTVAQLRQGIADRDATIAQLQQQAQAAPAVAPAMMAAPDAGGGTSGAPGIEGVNTTYDAKAGTVTADLPGDLLFAPGKADVKSSAKATLDKIVAALNGKYAGRRVYVDGHTDSDPVRRSAGEWDDNRDLSYARAKSVTDYLEKAGVGDKRVTIRAYGENNPKASKAASRRVEVVVVVR